MNIWKRGKENEETSGGREVLRINICRERRENKEISGEGMVRTMNYLEEEEEEEKKEKDLMQEGRGKRRN